MDLKLKLNPIVMLERINLVPNIIKRKSPLSRKLKTREQIIKNKRKFKCYFCSKSSGTLKDLYRHLYIHTKEEVYQCSECKLTFSLRSNLSKHVIDIHTKSTLKCAKCPRKFYKEEKYKDHILRHEGKATIKCSKCPRLYHTQNILRTHIKRIHNGKIHKCNLCHRILSTSYTLKLHIEAVHQKLKNKTCSFCPRQFYGNPHLVLHMNRVHFKQKVVGKCSEPGCNFAFNNETSAYLHRRKYHPRHNEQTEFKCEVCFKIFPTKPSLTQHVKLHSKRDRHKCPFCQKEYFSKHNLNDHIVSAHTAERAFKCDRAGCGKKFATAANLIGHKRAHLDSEQGLIYKCDKCEMVYKSRSGLKGHKYIQHKGKEFCCYFCKSVKRKNAELVRHMQEHTGEKPYNCVECRGKREFRHKNQLDWHLIGSHGKPRPQFKKSKCYFCMKILDRCKLSMHMRKHTTEKPYICKQCENSEFERLEGLKTHCSKAHETIIVH